MKTKPPRRRIHFVTLGCSKNTVDSEVLMHQFKTGGWDVLLKGNDLTDSVVVINTCGFIHDAKEESINTILEFARERKLKNIGQLFVMGCLVERYCKELQAEIHEVDGFFGVNEMPAVIAAAGADYRKELLGQRLISTPSHYAYLKISEGCDRSCSFCAIPLIRGKHRSKPAKEVISEAEFLASKGVKELMLIAQDLTWYGIDLYKKRMLVQLVEKLTEVNGIEWIRLHYAYPAGFPVELLDVMRNSEKVCNYLDIPLQHISDPVLKSMKRGHTGRQARELIRLIREKVPGIALRTTLITGYPGESHQDFEALLDFVKETRFERLGVFAYSHEEDTAAYLLEDDLPAELKEERVAQLMEIQENISLDLNRKKTGQIFKTIIDRQEGDFWIGRTESDSPEVDNEVLIPATEDLRVGNFYNVRITEAEVFDLYGEIVQGLLS